MNITSLVEVKDRQESVYKDVVEAEKRYAKKIGNIFEQKINPDCN